MLFTWTCLCRTQLKLMTNHEWIIYKHKNDVPSSIASDSLQCMLHAVTLHPFHCVCLLKQHWLRCWVSMFMGSSSPSVAWVPLRGPQEQDRTRAAQPALSIDWQLFQVVSLHILFIILSNYSSDGSSAIGNEDVSVIKLWFIRCVVGKVSLECSWWLCRC